MPNQILSILLILITVSLNTLAQALLKIGSGYSLLNTYLLSGLLVYAISTVFYISILGKFNLSVAYPITIGSTILATTMTGAFIFNEKVEPAHWLGIGLMLSGILVIALRIHQ